MRTLAPVMLGPRDTVTLRCGRCGAPTQFVRDFGAGGTVTCTPLKVNGNPWCSVCTPDEDVADALNAGAEVELEN